MVAYHEINKISHFITQKKLLMDLILRFKNRNLYGQTQILDFITGDEKFRILESETKLFGFKNPKMIYTRYT